MLGFGCPAELTMSHTYSKILIHAVFSTCERKKTIRKEFQTRLWKYMAGTCANIGVDCIAIGGIEDHVHLFLKVPPALSVSKVMGVVKANSSRWAGEMLQPIRWQEGYSAFSVSESNAGFVIRYIRNQESHHQKKNFEQEFGSLLKKHGVKLDERFPVE